jgi:hypothetical protein
MQVIICTRFSNHVYLIFMLQKHCQDVEEDRKPTTEPLHSVQQPEFGVLLDESEEAHLLLMKSIVHAWDDQDDTPTSGVQDPDSTLLFYAALEPKSEPLRLEVANPPLRRAGATSEAELVASAGKQLRKDTHGIHTLLFDVSAAISQVLVASDSPPSTSCDEPSARPRSAYHQQSEVSPEASGAKARGASHQQHSPPPWGLCPVYERALLEPSRTSPDQRQFLPMHNIVTKLFGHDGPDSQTRRSRSPDDAAARACSASYQQHSPPDASDAGHKR